ncbi:MAG: TIR domain-containing protein [Candidatus Methanospirareceae archaeon]
MESVKFEFGSSSQYVKLIDDTFGIETRSLLQLLAKNCHKQYGFNYELGSKIEQYYSNVHATVLFNLHLSNLLNERELKILQDSLFYLRDFNPHPMYKKTDEDKYAWDVIEGPSSFSTALACYSLLLTRDSRMAEIEKSIKWLLQQRNNKEIWPTFKKGEPNNYVTTLYSIHALLLFTKLSPNKVLRQEINLAFQEVKKFIENSFRRDGHYYFVPKYRSDEPCLSNAIVSLYLLKILGSNRFSEIYDGAKKMIEQIVLEDNDWYISILSDVRRANRIKTMYTYNPAYLLILLQLGWDVTDRIILKMLFWIVSDLKNFWIRKDIIYPWRSSDSVIQTFICGFSIQSVYTWVRRYLKASIGNIEKNLDNIVSRKDIFLCHASEDKEEYAKPLYNELINNGISVWYDEGEILWGDSITDKIQEGIKLSRFAIICFSKNFLKKDWANSEFRNLYQRQQTEGRKIILPLILNSKEEVLERYPLIKDIAYEEWSKRIPYLVSQIKKILK